MQFFLIQVSVWIAVAGWFVGAVLLLQLRSLAASGQARHLQSRAGKIWLSGCVFMAIHIVSSYALEHGWSHQTALRFTGDQSEAVTGLRAEWGLYVNFAFVIVWLFMAVRMMGNRPMPKLAATLAHGFLAMIVFFATVVFESGYVRLAALIGFVALAIAFRFFARRSRHGIYE